MNAARPALDRPAAARDDLCGHYVSALGLWAVSLVAQGHNLRLCAAGDLRAVNAAYKAARAAALDRGERFGGYREYLVQFERSMLEEIAATVRGTAVKPSPARIA